MKKILIFTACFLLGAGGLIGGAMLTMTHLRNHEKTAMIDASAVEPAAGTETATPPSPGASGDLMPATATPVEDIEATDPILRLTPDKTEMIPLSREAHSIVIGNPEHASVLMDSPKMLLVVPKKPGATYFSVLDKEGEVIMQRHVVVAGPAEKYVRIRRSCSNATRQGNCVPVSVYYCPDMCHEVTTDANSGGRR